MEFDIHAYGVMVEQSAKVSVLAALRKDIAAVQQEIDTWRERGAPAQHLRDLAVAGLALAKKRYAAAAEVQHARVAAARDARLKEVRSSMATDPTRELTRQRTIEARFSSYSDARLLQESAKITTADPDNPPSLSAYYSYQLGAELRRRGTALTEIAAGQVETGIETLNLHDIALNDGGVKEADRALRVTADAAKGRYGADLGVNGVHSWEIDSLLRTHGEPEPTEFVTTTQQVAV
jgi:hypothetical protein